MSKPNLFERPEWGRAPRVHDGLGAFQAAHRTDRLMIVGENGTPLGEFLGMPVAAMLGK